MGVQAQSPTHQAPTIFSWRTWRRSGLESSRGGETPHRMSDSQTQTVCTDKPPRLTDKHTVRQKLRVATYLGPVVMKTITTVLTGNPATTPSMKLLTENPAANTTVMTGEQTTLMTALTDP